MQRAALVTLFAERERAGQLLLWRDPRPDALRDAPTLGLLAGAGAADAPLALAEPDVAALALPLPARTIAPAEVAAHFRVHPDGWEAWFRRFAGSGGVVELTVPRAVAADTALVVVGRACGEHCRQAWRVTVAREGRAWRTASVEPLALPRH